MNGPRAFRDERDLPAMLDILIHGRQANNGSYYIHTGDLRWWLYYPPLGGDFWDHIHLWDDPHQTGRLMGWALISPDWLAIDVYVQPELRGSAFASEMYIWAEEQAIGIARAQERHSVSALWIRHDDEVLKERFVQRGFRLKRGMIQFCRSLDGELPAPRLPYDYILRGCKGEPEVAARAKAQYGAFSSTAPFGSYLERFKAFMRSRVYEPELDIVAVAPDGVVAAFCIVWTDLVNQVGLFEPVGTHPDFQRRGLGSAIMLEGLRRLQERGMKNAIVSTGEDNQAGIRLYESVGFQAMYRLGTYEKEL